VLVPIECCYEKIWGGGGGGGGVSKDFLKGELNLEKK